MRFGIAIVCLIALTLAAGAQSDDLPSPTAVPYTPEPRQVQWRLGFDLGNLTILETPELNPDRDFKSAITEAERILPRPGLSYGLALLPFMKVKLRTEQLVNPRQWTILDLQGRAKQKNFQGLGIFMGSRMTSTEGGFHLVSVAAMPSDPFIGVRQEPFDGDLVVWLRWEPQVEAHQNEVFGNKMGKSFARRRCWQTCRPAMRRQNS